MLNVSRSFKIGKQVNITLKTKVSHREMMDAEKKDNAQVYESPESSEKRERVEKEADKKVPLDKLTKAELIQKLKEAEESAKKYLDLYVRAQAEMDNLKKRLRKEKEEFLKFANESLIKELLPVVDNLENALRHAKDENSVDALREGIELTLKGMKDALSKAGVEEVKALGERFDPNYHHAVSQEETDQVETGTVLQELQKGYTLNQRLLRPAMVVVSKSPEQANSSSEAQKDLDS